MNWRAKDRLHNVFWRAPDTQNSTEAAGMCQWDRIRLNCSLISVSRTSSYIAFAKAKLRIETFLILENLLNTFLDKWKGWSRNQVQVWPVLGLSQDWVLLMRVTSITRVLWVYKSLKCDGNRKHNQHKFAFILILCMLFFSHTCAWMSKCLKMRVLGC